MPKVKYIIKLSETEKEQLKKIEKDPKSKPRTQKRARILLLIEAHPKRELIEKFEFHFTPKHASWLNMAEIEFSALFGQALNKRIPNQEQLKKEVLAWETYRNEHSRTIDWKFTTDDARKKLYPTIVEK